MSEKAGEMVAPTDAETRSAQSRAAEPTAAADVASGSALSDRARAETASAPASLEDRNIAVAVPIRAVERNRRVAATVLAGGLAYRIFLWLLPFGLVVGGGLGLSNADSTEDAVSRGGLPGAVTNAVGDAARSAQSDSWWLLAIGVPLLLWAGFSGGKATVLVHSLVWDDPPPEPKPLKVSLAFGGTILAFLATVTLTWWLRDNWPGYLAPIMTFAPLAALWIWVSLKLPHRDAPWTALVPGALVIAIGFQVLHEAVGYLLVPKLEKSTSLYGSLGATTTLLFFMYMLGILVVSAAVLNASLYEELTLRRDGAAVELTSGRAAGRSASR
jgi:membrane protein